MMKSVQSIDKIALAHSEHLTQQIRDLIQQKGPIPFSEYMQRVLYAPGLGYYASGSHKIGTGGDFTTAPEISALFGHCLAQQILQIQQQSGLSAILEFGPGTGRLAATLLTALDQHNALPDKYYLLEVSPELKERQQSFLSQTCPQFLTRCIWLDSLENLNFEGIVIANEVLDAMPVHRFHLNDTLQEYYVDWQNDQFVWQLKSCSEELKKAVEKINDHWPQNYSSEINLNLNSWFRMLDQSIKKGAVLIIDYGMPREIYYHPDRHMGTLMCYYQQQVHDNPFCLPGLQDITAHVDFTAVAEAASDAGFQVAGFTTQAYFLFNCGLEQCWQQLVKDDAELQWQLAQQIKQLTLPTEMGEACKVIALTKGLDILLRGFELNDMRERL